MKKFKYETEEVIYFKNSSIEIFPKDLIFLKTKAQQNKNKKIRICTHNNIKAQLQEMFIVHHKSCLVKPHRHINKPESIYIIEGEVDLVLFNNDGSLKNVINMGDINSKKTLYYRINEPIFHTLLIKSDFLVFHEVTQGPFERKKTEYPPWAPKNKEDSEIYFNQLIKLVR